MTGFLPPGSLHVNELDDPELLLSGTRFAVLWTLLFCKTQQVLTSGGHRTYSLYGCSKGCPKTSTKLTLNSVASRGHSTGCNLVYVCLLLLYKSQYGNTLFGEKVNMESGCDGYEDIMSPDLAHVH